MMPLVGDIVQYRLSATDVKQITRARSGLASIALSDDPVARASDIHQMINSTVWPGSHSLSGHTVGENSIFPLVVLKVLSGGRLNGRLDFHQGDYYWVKSAYQGDTPGTWTV